MPTLGLTKVRYRGLITENLLFMVALAEFCMIRGQLWCPRRDGRPQGARLVHGQIQRDDPEG